MKFPRIKTFFGANIFGGKICCKKIYVEELYFIGKSVKVKAKNYTRELNESKYKKRGKKGFNFKAVYVAVLSSIWCKTFSKTNLQQ